MKHAGFFSILLLLSIWILTSCGGGGGGEDSSRMYKQSETVDAAGGERTITLSSLTTQINSVSNNASWVTASPQFYTSGSPKLLLNIAANPGNIVRKCEIMITAQSGDKVALTLTQLSAEDPNYGIDDMHDNMTTQPAYLPQR